MDIIADFVAFCLDLIPFLLLVAIALTVFWIATLLIPSLGEWMTNTDGMAETEAERYERTRPASPTFDKYV